MADHAKKKKKSLTKILSRISKLLVPVAFLVHHPTVFLWLDETLDVLVSTNGSSTMNQGGRLPNCVFNISPVSKTSKLAKLLQNLVRHL